MMSTHNNKRLAFVDLARAYAVCLALLAHLLLATDITDQLGSSSLYIKQFTRMATPMFVFMFGLMVGLVYVRKAMAGHLVEVKRRLLVRSFQCYFAFALISLCALLGGEYHIGEFAKSLIFLADSQFGNILRVYSVIMLIVPMFIRAHIAFGPSILYVLFLVLMASYGFVESWQTESFGPWDRPLNILFGIGGETGGPSVWGALSFFVAGMIIAASVRARGAEEQLHIWRFFRATGILFATCVFLSVLMIDDNPLKAWIAFVNGTYRKYNAPGYFLIGTMTSLSMFCSFYFLFHGRTITQKLHWIMPLGMSSLISYTTGNMLLNLFGMWLKIIPVSLTAAVFFLSVYLITRYLHKSPGYSIVHAWLNFRSSPSLTKA